MPGLETEESRALGPVSLVIIIFQPTQNFAHGRKQEDEAASYGTFVVVAAVAHATRQQQQQWRRQRRLRQRLQTLRMTSSATNADYEAVPLPTATATAFRPPSATPNKKGARMYLRVSLTKAKYPGPRAKSDILKGSSRHKGIYFSYELTLVFLIIFLNIMWFM